MPKYRQTHAQDNPADTRTDEQIAKDENKTLEQVQQERREKEKKAADEAQKRIDERNQKAEGEGGKAEPMTTTQPTPGRQVGGERGRDPNAPEPGANPSPELAMSRQRSADAAVGNLPSGANASPGQLEAEGRERSFHQPTGTFANPGGMSGRPMTQEEREAAEDERTVRKQQQSEADEAARRGEIPRRDQRGAPSDEMIAGRPSPSGPADQPIPGGNAPRTDEQRFMGMQPGAVVNEDNRSPAERRRDERDAQGNQQTGLGAATGAEAAGETSDQRLRQQNEVDRTNPMKDDAAGRDRSARERDRGSRD